jgi:4-hydroxy-3-methylbut-2-enyl diphosphate reductase
MTKPALAIILAEPRGFCAGVVRAIDIVEQTLERVGGPVYMKHEIVHNRFVVKRLEAMGAIFVEDVDEIPDGATVVFSAHGVPKLTVEAARKRGLTIFDATCPLVSKVHVDVQRHARMGRRVVLIGQAGHPEVVGTMGQLPAGEVILVEDVEDAQALDLGDSEPVGFVTQTTLSVEDAGEVAAALTARFSTIRGPHANDICYATTNRQAAVKAMVSRVDVLVVIGDSHSSNSRKLVETAKRAGCARSILTPRAASFDWTFLDGAARLGVTAGASAPEELVQEMLDACRARYDVSIETVSVAVEDVSFNLPRPLSGDE